MNDQAVDARIKRRNIIISEAMLIAAAPLLGSLILTYYYKKVEANLGVPETLWSGNLFYSVGIGLGLIMLLTLMFWLSEIISRLIPVKKQNPFLVRLRRITQVSLFFTLGLLLQTIIGYENDFLSQLPTALSMLAAVYLIFSIREIGFPLIQFRKEKKFRKRLERHNSNVFYQTPSTYYKSFLKPTSLGLLFIPFVIMVTLVSAIATSHTDMAHPREYMIINTNPKRIVLVNYGDRWLTAVYDESFPGRPAYRKNYQVINSDDFGKSSFTVKDLDMLYVYN